MHGNNFAEISIYPEDKGSGLYRLILSVIERGA